jgi:hypothetical protein
MNQSTTPSYLHTTDSSSDRYRSQYRLSGTNCHSFSGDGTARPRRSLPLRATRATTSTGSDGTSQAAGATDPNTDSSYQPYYPSHVGLVPLYGTCQILVHFLHHRAVCWQYWTMAAMDNEFGYVNTENFSPSFYPSCLIIHFTFSCYIDPGDSK